MVMILTLSLWFCPMPCLTLKTCSLWDIEISSSKTLEPLICPWLRHATEGASTNLKLKLVSLLVLCLSGSYAGHQQCLSDTSTKEAWSVCAAHYGHTRRTGGHRQRGGPPFTSVHTPYHLRWHRPHPWWRHLREHRHGIPGGVTSPPWALPAGRGILWGGG